MVAFGHTAVGVIIGSTTYEVAGKTHPYLGLVYCGILSFTSHYLADLIPHGHFIKSNNYKKQIIWVIIFDLFVSLVLFLDFALWRLGISLKLFYVLVGVFGSQLPDMIDGLIYIKKLPKTGVLKIENSIHEITHWHGHSGHERMISIWDIWQLSVIIFSLYLVSKF